MPNIAGIAHEQRRRDFRIAVLIRVQIEHELRERALKPRELAFQHDEARARKLRRRLEIHEAQAFAEFEMLLRRVVELSRLAPAQRLDIVVLVLAVRHALQRRVGKLGQRVFERLDRLAFGGLQLRPVFLDLRDLGLQRLGFCLILLLQRDADLLRRGVAALLRALQRRDRSFARVVVRKQSFGDGLEAAPRAGRVEGLRIVANELDVVHEGSRFRKREAALSRTAAEASRNEVLA